MSAFVSLLYCHENMNFLFQSSENISSSGLSRKRKDSPIEREVVETGETKTRRIFHQNSSFFLTLYNLERPSLGMSDYEFSSLRGQVEQIEALLANRADCSFIREEIQEILQSSSFLYKIRELALLRYFLINKPNDIKKKHSSRFLQWALELEAGVNDPDKTLYEKLFFLQFSLVQMAFIEESRELIIQNRGGLLAIEDLLKNSTIALRFRDEHRRHILSVVNSLLKAPSFSKIFKKRVTVAEEMQNVIRLDLNLAFEEKCRPIHAHYATLLALFTDCRQGEEANCYVIGTFNALSQSCTMTIYSSLLELVTTGKFPTWIGEKIPIFPLFAELFLNKRDIFEEQFTEITDVGIASSKLTLFDEKEFEEEVEIRIEENFLHQLFLQVLEFQRVNRTLKESGDSDSFPKNLFVEKLIFQLKEYLSQNDPALLKDDHDNTFFLQLKHKLNSTLWMCLKKPDKVFEWEFCDYYVEESRIVKLFYLDETRKKFAFLDSIKSLSALLSELVKVVVNELPAKEWKEQLRSSVKGFFSSQHFWKVCREAVLQKEKDEERRAEIKKTIEESDLLFFLEEGGDGKDIIDLFNLAAICTNFYSDSCEHFVKQLHERLHSLEWNSDPSCSVFVQSWIHSFTFNPDLSSWFWKIPGAYALEEAITAPGKALMDTKLSLPFQQYIVDALNRSVSFSTQQISNNAEISLREFRDNILKLLEGSQRQDFLDFLNDIVKRIPLFVFSEEKVGAIFQLIGIKLDSIQLKEVLSELKETLKEGYFYPHTYARKLNKFLVRRSFPFQNLGSLEYAIARCFSLPPSIDVGDSNHEGGGKFVKPAHLKWVVGYDYGREKASFFAREKDRDIPLPKKSIKSLLKNFEIIIPGIFHQK